MHMAFSFRSIRCGAVNLERNISKRWYTAPSVGCIDVHTHMYLPRYVNLLKERNTVPKIINYENKNRLVILPNEDNDNTTKKGRVIENDYYDIYKKLDYKN